jgi:hypothetical protein
VVCFSLSLIGMVPMCRDFFYALSLFLSLSSVSSSSHSFDITKGHLLLSLPLSQIRGKRGVSLSVESLSELTQDQSTDLYHLQVLFIFTIYFIHFDDLKGVIRNKCLLNICEENKRRLSQSLFE